MRLKLASLVLLTVRFVWVSLPYPPRIPHIPHINTQYISHQFQITIVNVLRGKVRLGITAPENIPVHRREVYEAIQREKAEERAAAKNKVMNNRTGNNPVGIDGIDNIDEVQESERTVELISGIPV